MKTKTWCVALAMGAVLGCGGVAEELPLDGVKGTVDAVDLDAVAELGGDEALTESELLESTVVEVEPDADWSADAEDDAFPDGEGDATVTATGDEVSLLAQGLPTGSDAETKKCGAYREYAKTQWELQRQAEQIQIISNLLKQLHETQERIIGNLAFLIQFRTRTRSACTECLTDSASGAASAGPYTWWSSGARKAKSGQWKGVRGKQFPRIWLKNKDRPYVHLEMGKIGDGKANCAFDIYPLERG